jgi:hypothetical protein
MDVIKKLLDDGLITKAQYDSYTQAYTRSIETLRVNMLILQMKRTIYTTAMKGLE